MTTRADGLRRIATANATIATFSAAGVVGLSVMLAQQGTHHNAATVPAATSTTATAPATATSTSSSDDDTANATTTVTTTPQATVQQATSGSAQHAVTSGS